MASSPLVHVYTPSNLPEPSPQALTPSVEPVRNSGTTPPSADLPPTRQASTPGMDTLADLASMQQHQPQRPTGLRNAEPFESQLSPSTMNPTVPPVVHTTPTPRPPFEVAMSDGSAEAPRRDYSNTALNPEAQRTANELFNHIQSNRHAYDSRVKFIRVLHQGFVDHVYPPSSPGSRGDPHSYDVLRDLRIAREELDRLFATGEDPWAEWIQDESLLSRTTDERLAVQNLCQRSVEEEFGSTKLWVIYGDWVLYLYNSAAQTGQSPIDQGHWSEEDKIIGREVFKWDMVLDVWRKGAEATKWRINDSHLVWNRYLELAMQDLATTRSPEGASQLRKLFESRLEMPHMAWDQTFQLFSSFVSTYYNTSYEDIMVETTAKAATGKAICAAREINETALERAAQAGDTAAEWTTFAQYLEWEVDESHKQRPFGYRLATALYQRAVLRFPTDANIWDEYVTYLVGQCLHRKTNESPIPTLKRAARHCPWSGSLWAQYLLCAEISGYPFSDVADIKHQATSTGLLDAAGVEEVLKVETTWCSFLRRRAFQANSTDEDLDVAEVGIRSAIESVQELGDKSTQTAPNDPLFRLERIYIRYLSESGSWDSARETFKGLVSRHGHSYEFWLAYYTWELLCWSKFTQSGDSATASRRTPNPSLATAILKRALETNDLDWPEKIIDTYIAHCEQYEDAEELQLSMLEIRKASKSVAKRREREAQEAAAAQQQQAAAFQAEQAEQAAHKVPEDSAHVGKRKRDAESDMNGLVSKKPKSIDTEAEVPGEEATQALPKRDREHASVLVTNLPRDISPVKVRQFFRDCGTINSLKMLPPEDDSVSALIEFDTKVDAAAAQTRGQKTIDGHIIGVQIETETTLFVTNFPPEADEAYMRNLFHPYGEIVDIRFPSLKYNTRRRFCYVQFTSATAARAATALDKKSVSPEFELSVNISNPSKRQARSGAFEEGREIHISNLPWKATQSDLVELFTAYGNVEAVRIPTKANGGSKGFAFVAFTTPEAANAALAMDQKEFHSRPLSVRLSTPTGPKRLATTIISRTGHSKSPSVEPNGSAHSPSSSIDQGGVPQGDRKLRTIGLMNVPDTVKDARIRSLVEPFGPLVKIVLRPDHQGAIVEFIDVNDAGNAALRLEGQEIAPDRRLRVGPVEEMLKQSAEHKVDRIQVGKQRGKPAMMVQPAAPIKRPGYENRGGRRGGLGLKRGGINGKATPTGGETTKAEHQPSTSDPPDEKRTQKSNDDFRAMLAHSTAKPPDAK